MTYLPVILVLIIAIPAIVIVYSHYSKKGYNEESKKTEWDEREKIERYKAGFISFFVLISFLFIIIFYLAIEKESTFPVYIFISAAVVLSLTVYLCICIWKDVFLNFKQPSNALLFCYILWTIVFLGNSVLKFTNPETENYNLAIYYLMFGTMFLVVLINIIAKKNSDKKKGSKK